MTRRYALLGCPFDNGIRSMLRYGRGVTGAADGPEAVIDAVRTQYPELAEELDVQLLDLQPFNLPLDHNLENPSFTERQLAATLEVHAAIERAVNELIQNGRMPIGIGGDHSITYPLARGTMTTSTHDRWGLIYIDAHLDLRAWGTEDGEDVLSSGNAFWRLLNDPDLPLSGSNVVALGVQPSDTDVYRTLARCAETYGMTVVDRSAISERNLDAIVSEALYHAGHGTDAIYLSLDMDAFDASVAPGVSAPNAGGLTETEGLDLMDGLAQDRRVRAMDVVETSSRETAWSEIMENDPRDEPLDERADKLERTAHIAAEAIQRFINAKTAPSSP
mgnify:CR=1 FL=1